MGEGGIVLLLGACLWGGGEVHTSLPWNFCDVGFSWGDDEGWFFSLFQYLLYFFSLPVTF